MASDETQILARLIRGDFRLTAHARMRMRERGVTHSDIRNVGSTWVSVVDEDGGKLRAQGLDIDGDSLNLIVALDIELVIITVF